MNTLMFTKKQCKGLFRICLIALLLPVFHAAAQSARPTAYLDNHLVAYYPFNRASGGTAFDASGNNQHGVLTNGPTWVAGSSAITEDAAIEFDGEDDSVDIGNLDIVGEELTISARFRADNFDERDGRIVSKATGVKTQDHFWMVSTTYFHGTYRLRFRVKTDDGGTATLIANTELSPNTWTHVVATYDGSTMKIYKDGVEDASMAKNGNLASDPSVSASIGRNPNDDVEFDGAIDEVRLYKVALDASEVAILFNEVPLLDTEPDVFSFVDQDDAEISSANQTVFAESNIIQVEGINAATDIQIEGGEYSIDGAGFTSASGLVNNNQQVVVRVAASTKYGTTTSATLTIGGVSATFRVTTRPNPDLVAYYSFNEPSGVVVLDESGHGRDGTIRNNAARVAGISGMNNDGAIEFDGEDDSVDIGTIDIPGSELSLSAWFRADNFDEWDGRIISKATGTAEQDHYWMVSTTRSSQENRLRFRLKTDNGGTTTLVANTELSAGTWTHVVATYDGSAMKIYKDGVEDGSKVKSGSLVGNASVPASIGRNPNDDVEFDGVIDEVLIYNKVLSAEEVAALYSGQDLQDTEPDAFNFVAQVDVPVSLQGANTWVESNAILVSGISTNVVISISGGEYAIDGEAFTSEPGTVSNGQQVVVRQIASTEFTTTTLAELTIGDASATFSVTTQSNPDLKSLRLSWNIPQTREDGSALAVGEISRYEIRYRQVGSGAYTYINVTDANQQELVVDSLDVGDYEFSITACDTSEICSSVSENYFFTID